MGMAEERLSADRCQLNQGVEHPDAQLALGLSPG